MVARSITGGMDPYAELGLERTVEASEIRARYRELASRHHPDRNPDDPEATARMGRINRAYAMLSEPTRRARVDAELRGRAPKPWVGVGSQDLDAALFYAWLSRRMRRAKGWQRVLVGVGGLALQWLRDTFEERDEDEAS